MRMGSSGSTEGLKLEALQTEVRDIIQRMYPGHVDAITKVMTDSVDGAELRKLVNGDHFELYKSIRAARTAVSMDKRKTNKEKKIADNSEEFRTKLCHLFKSQSSSVLGDVSISNQEAEHISDVLIGLSEVQRRTILSNDQLLKEFIDSQLAVLRSGEESDEEGSDMMEKAVTSTTTSTTVTEDRDGEMDGLKERLLDRLTEIHPAHANYLCGVMLDLAPDVLVQIISHDSWLFRHLAKIFESMRSDNLLSTDESAIITNELAELVYARLRVLYPLENESMTGRVTGIMLDLGIVRLCELLVSDREMKSTAELVFEAIEEEKRT